MSTFVNCRDCGYVAECPSCDTALTFHYQSLNLICHHCGYKCPAPTVCPNCKGLAIKYFGSGTQKVEIELLKLFRNKINIGRMDKDTTQKRDSHTNIYNSFANQDTDILVGTQMISKGWDLPNIGLVGIVSADTMINFPDFSAGERTFNLLTQVAGRTGRGKKDGRVVLQTYNPDHPAIKFARGHDFVGYYESEINIREESNYPPFATLIKLMYNNVVQSKSEEATIKLCKTLKELHPEIEIIGPSPAFLPKISGKYRWQIVLKLADYKEEDTIKVVKEIKSLIDNNWTLDVDPTSTL
jgi:primosomal protein N' (replication factor Y)